MAELLNQKNKPIKRLEVEFVWFPEIGKPTTFSLKSTNDVIQTSLVENIHCAGPNWVQFETAHSIYNLHGQILRHAVSNKEVRI